MPHVIVRAQLVGPRRAEWAELILDTGATHTVIDELIAFRIGYAMEAAPKVSLTTVSGTSQASVITVRQLFALGESVSDFQVLALPLPIQLRADGFLGLDFLRRHNLFCNFANFPHRLVLSGQVFAHL